MNCEDFNDIIHELAEDKPMQVATREAGVSHVALCADCASKLANARSISAALRLAAGAESEAAPVQIKQNLLAAFAELNQAGTVSSSVVNIASRRKLYWWTSGALHPTNDCCHRFQNRRNEEWGLLCVLAWPFNTQAFDPNCIVQCGQA